MKLNLKSNHFIKKKKTKQGQYSGGAFCVSSIVEYETDFVKFHGGSKDLFKKEDQKRKNSLVVDV